MRDLAALDFFAEQAPDDVVVDGEGTFGEDRAAELLEFLEDLVVDAGVVVVGRPRSTMAWAGRQACGTSFGRIRTSGVRSKSLS